MDSMRSLNSSLPSSNPTAQPPEALLQAFKTAALSVTNLYKFAVADQSQVRHIGYQDALEDLRAFLDREGIGLTDGEGRKVRNWITDRIDGTGALSSDSDDEKTDTIKRNRSTSPNKAQKEARQSRSTSPRTEQPAQAQPTSANDASSSSRPTLFTFTAGPQFPSPPREDTDMRGFDVPTVFQNDHPSNHSHIASPSVRLEVVPRGPRTPHRSNSRHNGRSSTRETAPAIGSKRKFHFNEFFDISNIGNGKDGFGGGKRGRFT